MRLSDGCENGLIDMVGTLLSRSIAADKKKDILESRYGIPMVTEVERRNLDMCNLGEGIYRDGMKQGMENGMRQGMEQGMKQGMEKGTDHVNVLNTRLAEDGRTADIIRAAKEPEYQKQLFTEYGLV